MTPSWSVPSFSRDCHLSSSDKLVQAARRLYKTPGQHLTLGQVVELNRRLVQGYTHFKDEPRVVQLRKEVLKYNRLLRDLGLRDHQVRLLSSCLVDVLIQPGSESEKVRAEDAWAIGLSISSATLLDSAGPSWDSAKRTHLYPRVHTFTSKSQRSVN